MLPPAAAAGAYTTLNGVRAANVRTGHTLSFHYLFFWFCSIDYETWINEQQHHPSQTTIIMHFCRRCK
jgi:hypothetical protein